MPRIRRASELLLAGLLLAACGGLTQGGSPAFASRTQVALFQEDTGITKDPVETLRELRTLGVGIVRVTLEWDHVAPNPAAAHAPAGFNAADPGDPAYNWSVYDQIVQTARTDHIPVDFSVTGGAPIWATAGHAPGGGPASAWKPKASEFAKFVQAVATRYDGRYAVAGTTLPRVAMWEIWNEPNFGPDLAPQAVNASRTPSSAPMYRSLIDAAWSAFARSGHGRDTIILGNLDARGMSGAPRRGAPEGFPGNYAATKPLVFVRELYCVDGRLHPLRGSAAAAAGCPTTAAGSSRFGSAHPALFQAQGFADHPYPLTTPPTRADTRDPDQAEFSQLPHFIATMDGVQRAYRSGHRFAIYNNEYGYITNPPNRSQRFASPPQAAAYINQSEYLSWLNPRIASTMQFLLRDPNPIYAPEYGGFASGLITYGGTHKPGYDAYRLPIFLPTTTVKRGSRVLVWGCARPAAQYGNRRVTIQFQAGRRGAFTSLAGVQISNSRGYFEARVPVRASGSIRLAWTYPGGTTVYSRHVSVQVR